MEYRSRWGGLFMLAVLLGAAVPGTGRLAGVPGGQEPDDPLFLPDDLEVTLWAESPLFFNPTNIDIDVRGRVWVTEGVNYRDFNNPAEEHLHHAGGDRIVILEDTDGDGRADRSKVFVQDEDLRVPLGIAVIGNRVIVSTSPALLIYTDEDGDDRPDRKEVFLTGFGGFDHDHGLHAVVAGPDGRWYFNTGNAGPHTVTDRAGWTLRSGSLYTGGSPYNLENQGGRVSDDGRVWVGGLALRIAPDGTGLTVLGHNFRNAYELAVDSYGNLWQNDNDDEVVACRTTWLMEGGNTGYFSADGTRTWQADRRPGQDTFTAHWHQEDPGVIPAGDRTGAGAPTGIVVYEGDELGPSYRGMVLSADAGRNVVFGYHPRAQGAGYLLERMDFVTSVQESTEGYIWNDEAHLQDERKWFRPSDVAAGTDGALYVADWYDPIVGGHQMRDPDGYGRIYRITPKGRTLRAPEIDLRTTAGQVQALLSPAVNVRSLGFDRLRARGPEVVDAVWAVLQSGNPYHRARALWLLAHLGPEGLAEVERRLDDPDPNLRMAAFRALRQVQADVLPYARRLAKDPSPAVRREVALALRDVPLSRSRDLILDLAEGYDGEDPWYLEALGIAAGGKEEALYPVLLARLGGDDPVQWDRRFAGIAWRLHPAAAVDALKARAESPAVPEPERRRALVALGFVHDERAARAMADLARSDLPDVAAQAAWWLQYRGTNSWRAYDLGGEAVSSFAAPAAQEQMMQLRARAIDPAVPVDERIDAAAEMAGDPEGGLLLLGLALEKKLPYQVDQVVRAALFRNPDPAVRALAGGLYDPPSRPQALSVGAVAGLKADAGRGGLLFQARCASCHRVGSMGGEVGPELTHVRSKFDRAGLLDAIVNPGAAVAHGYEPLLITMEDGTTVGGLLLAEGETLTIKDAAGRPHVVEQGRIAARKTLHTSLMPDPAALGLSAQDVADIAAFLLAVEE